MLYIPTSLLNQPKPFRLVVGIQAPSVSENTAMHYFGVNCVSVLTYLLNSWSLFSTAAEDVVYEEFVESVTSGGSIFRLVEEWERTETFFGHLERLMYYVYNLRMHLILPLQGAFNPLNEQDDTLFTADWLDANTVCIHVHPRIAVMR